MRLGHTRVAPAGWRPSGGRLVVCPAAMAAVGMDPQRLHGAGRRLLRRAQEAEAGARARSRPDGVT